MISEQFERNHWAIHQSTDGSCETCEKVQREMCEHPYISWHGSRGECQDCGHIMAAPETNASVDILFDLTELFGRRAE